jgi:hypothetical protein
MTPSRAVALAAGAALVVAACSSSSDTSTRTTTKAGAGGGEVFYAGYTSDVYSEDAHWLCRPDLPADPCTRDLDATVVTADGTTTPEPFVPARQPQADCFYVYPTVRFGSEGNAQFDGNYLQETFTVRTQAARFGTECGVYAPLYRQRTLSAPNNTGVDYGAIAYADVIDAFRYYLGHFNEGRPFVLMGHSQGAGLLRRVIEEQIDSNAKLRDRMISALLLGSAVGVPDGEDVGGSFENVPACRAASDVGCVISYASFRSNVPPPDSSFFGRVREPGQRALCTNPGNLGGGSGPLVSYFDVPVTAQIIGRIPRVFAADAPNPPAITTPFVKMPDLVRAACVERGPFTYLELTLQPDPGPRYDNLGGDLTPDWGMHIVDANVALGNLVELVKAQTRAWVAAHAN